MVPKILTFDLEIVNAILGKDETPVEGINYCGGWKDMAGMGISLGCSYMSWLDSYEFYGENNIMDLIARFQEADLITGFNIHGFDVSLLKATLTRLGHPEKTGLAGKTYDIFLDIKKSLKNNFPKGWKMGNIAEATLGEGKIEDGAQAPVLWQRGEIAKVASYVCSDVKLEHKLFLHALKHGSVLNNHSEVDSVYLENIVKIREKLADIQAAA